MFKRGFITIFLYLFFITPLFAAVSEYMLIIDAGSSGARAHLYQYNISKNLTVTEIFSKITSLRLSNYMKESAKVTEELIKVVQQACQKVPQYSPIKIQVLATAGMRLLNSEEQNKIYAALKTVLENENKKGACQLIIDNMETISGKIEGIYAWLSVNYLMDNFTNNKPLVGVVDIGGASAQIIFLTQEKTSEQDSLVMNINGSPITIFSKSFLGLGQDAARRVMVRLPQATSCFQKGYYLKNKQEGHFNFEQCTDVYKKIVAHYNLKSMPSHNNIAFVFAMGAPQTVLGSFQAIANPSLSLSRKNIKEICSSPFDTRTWNPSTHEFNENRCANGTYLAYLIYQGLKLNPHKITISKTINNHSIDWSLGVLVYEWLNGADKRP